MAPMQHPPETPDPSFQYGHAQASAIARHTRTDVILSRHYAFFLGRLFGGVMPLGDKIDSVGPDDGFFDFGFLGSRLPRFCPLAIVRILCGWFGLVNSRARPCRSTRLTGAVRGRAQPSGRFDQSTRT
jgi:hypothetical protein